ncbi:hypothetical protein RRG08_047241 [Elysia crispata]|uniref:Uncharacterized protein n=1 Tax=Elysia crispata TaxID=231223 RepID=A0AAE1A4E2_9GAST|nr:hypothetical protein RRG08_047241 [Elysia crispata]
MLTQRTSNYINGAASAYPGHFGQNVVGKLPHEDPNMSQEGSIIAHLLKRLASPEVLSPFELSTLQKMGFAIYRFSKEKAFQVFRLGA